MQVYTSLFAITGALMAGAMSPGPSFLFVARNSIALSRNHGLATALGMGIGSLIFTILALMGLQALFIAVPFAFWALKVLGGLYLCYIALKTLRSARLPMSHALNADLSHMTLRKTMSFGLMTQLSNPKTAIVLASVYSALLPQEIPAPLYLIVPALAFCIDAGWYVIVAFALSTERPRKAYLKFKTFFDTTAGTVMALLGLKLIFSGSK
jgi:threonine/homoserine/homoserine lactone efflux protein